MSELDQFAELLLQSARNGDHKTVSEIIKAGKEEKFRLNINCKGQSKSNHGWTPIHLASYFGHSTCVSVLLANGAHIDMQNDSGDTALHKAALTNREDIVLTLLEKGADVSIVNGEGCRASDIARNVEVKNLILSAEQTELKKKEAKFLEFSREGNVEEIKNMLTSHDISNINCVDCQGNTALHCAAYRSHVNVAVTLLQNGCDPSIKNAAGQTALNLVQSSQMSQVLSVQPVRCFYKSVSRCEGPILKRTRIVGWKMVWAVLERGVFTFFSSRADASSGVGRRDFKYLDGAKVFPLLGGDQAIFVLHFNDGSSHRLAALPDPMRSASVNRQKWVSSLESHIRFSTHYVQNGLAFNDDDEDLDDKQVTPLGSMQDVLCTAKAHYELLEQQLEEATALISFLNDTKLNQGKTPGLIKKFSALATTARKMTCSLEHCMSLIQQQEEIRELQLKDEREKVRVLEESLRVLATEHHELEESIASHVSSEGRASGEVYNTPANSLMSLPRHRRLYNIEDEFYDAFSQGDDADTLYSIPSPCDSECSTNTLVSCMSSLPTDPASPDSPPPPIPPHQCLLNGSPHSPTNEIYTNGINYMQRYSISSDSRSGSTGDDAAVLPLYEETLLPPLSFTSTPLSSVKKERDEEGTFTLSGTPFSISHSASGEQQLEGGGTTTPTNASGESLPPALPLFKTSDLSEHDDDSGGSDCTVTSHTNSKKQATMEQKLFNSEFEDEDNGRVTRKWHSWGRLTRCILNIVLYA